MKKFFLFFLAAVFLTACRSLKETTHTDTERVTLYDTIHVVEAKTHHDSLHTEITTTQRVQVVEEFDDTGRLRRRVVESEASVKELRDALRIMQERLDSLAAHSVEEAHEETETEKEAEPVTPSPCNALHGIISGAVGLVLFFLALKFYPRLRKLCARNATA